MIKFLKDLNYRLLVWALIRYGGLSKRQWKMLKKLKQERDIRKILKG